jgi:hypothetical protein
MTFAPFWKSWGTVGSLSDAGLPVTTFALLPPAASLPLGTMFITSDNGLVINRGGVWCILANLGLALPTGDQLIVSQDTSPFREGSWSVTASGQLYTLVGDFAMKYWSHNTALDVNGNFLARDDAGPCAIMVFSEGIGVLAPSFIYYACPTGAAGTVPGTFTQVYRIDLTTGLATFANATFHTTTVALTNGAAAQAATLTNGPTAGNPTKWIPINDAGTTRYIPAW